MIRRGMAGAIVRAIAGARWGALTVALATAALPSSAATQQAEAIRRAFDLERSGDFAAAAQAYRAVLAERPTEAAALFGLERTLTALNRVPDVLPAVRAALAAAPRSTVFYGIALRGYAAAAQPDSVRAIARRWALAAPGDEAPFREWGDAALARGDRAEARRAYLAGREQLGRGDALAPELAYLAAQEQDWPGAVREWVAALGRLEAYRSVAVATLAGVPTAQRPELLRQLAADSTAAARALEADLRARWGDPVGGFEVLARMLPADRARAVAGLRGFLDQLRFQSGREVRLAQALAFRALADRSGRAEAARLRLEAAQAFADAGDQEAAHRMLRAVSEDASAPPGIASAAAATLVGVLLSQGKLAEAERQLAEAQPTLTVDDRAALRRRLALGWARAGQLGRADTLVAGDSTVEGLAVAGRIRLLAGDIEGARRRLQAAGPFAGTREEATARVALLAMLQPLEADTLPALGQALLRLERGDTAAAIRALERLAAELPPAGGAAGLRLYAGTIARAGGRLAEAERLLRAAADEKAPATAPAATLALAQVLLETGRRNEAGDLLEHLILAYPESALVPQARRTLDEARGAVPRT